jgi:hypothetical protein
MPREMSWPDVLPHRAIYHFANDSSNNCAGKRNAWQAVFTAKKH